jgi:hypothetical protein
MIQLEPSRFREGFFIIGRAITGPANFHKAFIRKGNAQ